MKPIKNYEGLYSIAKDGRVWSHPKPFGTHQMTEGDWIAIQDNGNGYKNVGLSLNKSRKIFYIHRLVAEAYIGDIGYRMGVNHIDGNKSNNHVSNLEIVTSSQNNIHAYELGLNPASQCVKQKNNKSGFVNIAPKFVRGKFMWCFTLRIDGKRFEKTSNNIYKCIAKYNKVAKEYDLPTHKLNKEDIERFGSGYCSII